MAYMHHKYRAGDSTNLVDVLQIPHQEIVRTLQQNSGRNCSARSFYSKHLFHLWWQRLDFVYDLINKVGDHHIVKPPLY